MTQIVHRYVFDRRTKAKVHCKIRMGVVTLRYKNLELKLSHAEAERIGELLIKVADAQNTHRHIRKEDEDD